MAPPPPTTGTPHPECQRKNTSGVSSGPPLQTKNLIPEEGVTHPVLTGRQVAEMTSSLDSFTTTPCICPPRTRAIWFSFRRHLTLWLYGCGGPYAAEGCGIYFCSSEASAGEGMLQRADQRLQPDCYGKRNRTNLESLLVLPFLSKLGK